jgi:hypothetical protein
VQNPAMPTGGLSSANPLKFQGDFGEMWLRTAASNCRIQHEGVGSLDLDKKDVELTWLDTLDGMRNPTVKVQVKTTVGIPRPIDGCYSYALDRDTYDFLRDSNHVVKRVLVVVWLDEADRWMEVATEASTLLGRGAWVDLEGAPDSENTTSVSVHLPVVNTLDCAGLRQLMTTCGVRQSSKVPETDVWGVDSAA